MPAGIYSGSKKAKYQNEKNKDRVKMLTGGQAAIAAKAPPPNKIDAKDFAVLRAEKAKGRGMGLQDESVKPGKVKPVKAALGVLALGALGAMGAKKLMKKKNKIMDPGGTPKGMLPINLVEMYKKAAGKKMGGVMKARVGKSIDGKKFMKSIGVFPKVSSGTGGKSIKVKDDSSFSKKMELQDKGVINKKTGAGREKITKAVKATSLGRKLLLPVAAGVVVSKYIRSKMKKDKNKKTLKDFREQKKPGVPSEKTKTINSALNKLNKKMGGGMMQKPMGYNTGGPSAGFKSKQDRKKAEKNIKQARSKEGLRSFLSSGNKINQPMRKERYMEGRKARHTEFKKKLGKTALGVVASLTPATAAAKVIGKVMGKKSKKRDFQKGDYGDISVKKMGGGMMQKPMGYNKGVMVKARGCKLGRTRPTKIT